MRAHFLRHLLTTRWHLRRAFTPAVLSSIESAIRASERLHGGELRVAIEAALDLDDLLAGITARERAIEVFNQLRVWDTEQNNGVLIYLLHADHALEIVADRGYNVTVDVATWAAFCGEATAALRAGQYGPGMTGLIERIGTMIARHFPSRAGDVNELQDAPLFL